MTVLCELAEKFHPIVCPSRRRGAAFNSYYSLCSCAFVCCLLYSAGYSEMESNFLFHKYDRDCDQVLSFLERRKMREDMAMGVGSFKTIVLI